MTAQVMGQPDFGTCTQELALTEKTERYYRAILALAKEQDIPIMVVIAPYGGMTQEDQGSFARRKKLRRNIRRPFSTII